MLPQETINDTNKFALEGALDAQMIGPIQKQFQDLLDGSKEDVTLDLSNVNFMDSSGVGSIVFLYKRLTSENRALTLVGLNGQPKKIIKFLRIDKIISVTDS